MANLDFQSCIILYILFHHQIKGFSMIIWLRDGDYDNLFTDLTQFPEVLKEKQVCVHHRTKLLIVLSTKFVCRPYQN